jgi:hypothetical protein
VPGYHVYFQKEPLEGSQWLPIDILAQVASAILWKRNFGPIHLVCNEQHLALLHQYDALKYYDSIDTTLLDDMVREVPEAGRNMRYWSFPKIYLANKLSQAGIGPFVILDTDLWVRRVPSTWDMAADMLVFHREDFDTNYVFNPYFEPRQFLPENDDLGLDWTVLPVNCALVYYNCPELVSRWYETCLLVIEHNNGKPWALASGDTLFIEQRLLPPLAQKLGYVLKSIIPSVYQTQVPHYSAHDTGQWEPPLNSNPEIKDVVSCITHIWGLKKSYEKDNIRCMVIIGLLGDLQDVLPPKYGDIDRKLLHAVRDLLPAAYLETRRNATNQDEYLLR